MGFRQVAKIRLRGVDGVIFQPVLIAHLSNVPQRLTSSFARRGELTRSDIVSILTDLFVLAGAGIIERASRMWRPLEYRGSQ